MSAAILLGIVAAPYGLKGEVKVKTFTVEPESFGTYGPLTSEDGRRFVVAHLRMAEKDNAIVRFSGIEDRNTAALLKGLRLSVPREALPVTATDEFYHADLIGLRVEDPQGLSLGTVKGVFNFGASDVIEIADEDGAERYLPFTHSAVPVVDIAARRIVVDPPHED